MLPELSEERLPFSKDQVKDLLRVADNQWQGMILLGYHTSIRLSDAANLTRANVDLLNRILIFRARKTASRIRTGQRDSVVYMHLDLVTYFEALPACRLRTLGGVFSATGDTGVTGNMRIPQAAR